MTIPQSKKERGIKKPFTENITEMTHGKKTYQEEWGAEKQIQECVVRNSEKLEILPEVQYLNP